MQNGLSAALINPLSEKMMKSFFAFSALMGYDSNCENYIRHCGDTLEKASQEVLNREYVDLIGADFYGKDAMQSVYFVQKVFQHEGGNE